MLTYGLTGTTEASGSTTTNPFRIRPARRISNPQPAPNLRAPWRASKDGAVLLTCDPRT